MHVEPCLDPHKIADLWYFDGPPDSTEKLVRSFAAVLHPVLPWRGDHPCVWMAPSAILLSSTPSALAAAPYLTRKQAT
jgi:hypothetical protein